MHTETHSAAKDNFNRQFSATSNTVVPIVNFIRNFIFEIFISIERISSIRYNIEERWTMDQLQRMHSALCALADAVHNLSGLFSHQGVVLVARDIFLTAETLNAGHELSL